MNQTDQSLLVNEIVSNFASSSTCKPNTFNGQSTHSFSSQLTLSFGSDRHPALKPLDSIVLINCRRDLNVFVHFLKVADVVLSVSSFAHVDVNNLNKMPEDALRIVDEIGNQAISIMRAQGQPPIVSVVTDIDQLDKSKHKDAKFYSKRLIAEEFGKDAECHVLEKQSDILKVLLDLHKKKLTHPNWRAERGYFLADKLDIFESNDAGQGVQKVAKISGYLRNSWGPENLGHITGYGDFQSNQIECIIESKGRQLLRLVKTPVKADDWRVLNDHGVGMDVEVSAANPNTHLNPATIPETDDNDEPEFDELAELKRDFQQLKITDQDGLLTRRCPSVSRSTPN